MAKKKKLIIDRVPVRWRRVMELSLILVVALSGFSLTQTIEAQSQPAIVEADTSTQVSPDVRASLVSTAKAINDIAAEQQQNQVAAIDIIALRNQYADAKASAISGRSPEARTTLKTIKTAIDAAKQTITNAVMSRKASVQPAATTANVVIPILIYHETPANFEQQLDHLKAAGYTTITMDQAYAGVHNNQPLPSKPVVITYDDGLASQMTAYEALKARGMKATYYIITAGPESHWCIGAGRRYNDPVQPPGGCGDAYLSWDQVRMLDRSGLIEIAAHTVNHRNLASLDLAGQQYEIGEGKRRLEAEIGHPIHHIAYPYGQFNQATLQVTASVGYRTGVTTAAGTNHNNNALLTMPRVRNALQLP